MRRRIYDGVYLVATLSRPRRVTARNPIFVASFVASFVDKARDKARDKDVTQMRLQMRLGQRTKEVRPRLCARPDGRRGVFAPLIFALGL